LGEMARARGLVLIPIPEQVIIASVVR
jgi:hypothetical protein